MVKMFTVSEQGHILMKKVSIVLLTAAGVLLCQPITSSLVGIVPDDSGAIVPNASVTATNVATNARLETITASNVSGLGNPTERTNNNGHSAELSGDIHNQLGRYFDTSVFSQPGPFTLGNTGPYISDLRSPGVANSDLSLFKEFFPREYLRV